MSATFRGTRTLRFLWNVQAGLCAICKERITRITGWRLHYCVPACWAARTALRTVLYFIQSATTGFIANISVSKPRLPERGVRRA